MKRIHTIHVIALALLLVLGSAQVLAHSEDSLAQAQQVIQDKTPCGDLSEDDLEQIGDYYMELMHPGEQHEAMDAMMGGEGSQALRDMHIAMARTFYCGESGAMNMTSMQAGMMQMMGGEEAMMGNSMQEMDMMQMMGMMAMKDTLMHEKGADSMAEYGDMGAKRGSYGMMGVGMGSWSMNPFGAGLFWLFWVALTAAIFAIVFWWVYTLMVREPKPKKK